MRGLFFKGLCEIIHFKAESLFLFLVGKKKKNVIWSLTSALFRKGCLLLEIGTVIAWLLNEGSREPFRRSHEDVCVSFRTKKPPSPGHSQLRDSLHGGAFQMVSVSVFPGGLEVGKCSARRRWLPWTLVSPEMIQTPFTWLHVIGICISNDVDLLRLQLSFVKSCPSKQVG